MYLQDRLKIQYPIIQAPMAGSDNASLVAAACNAGILGSLGAQYRTPEDIAKTISEIRSLTDKPFAVNLFALQPQAVPSAQEIEEARSYLERYYSQFGVPSPSVESVQTSIDPEAQLEAILQARVPVFSFTLGLLSEKWMRAFKDHSMQVIGTATNVKEARALEETGVDAIVAQGSEAGGHRGTFMGAFEKSMIGGMALIPQVVDAVAIPVIAAGGIMDGRGIAAAMALGAQGAQLGTAFLTVDESPVHRAYKQAIRRHEAEDTTITKVFSGGAARGIQNLFIEESSNQPILPFPYHNSLTRPFRKIANERGQIEYTNLWSGQGGRMAKEVSLKELVQNLMAQTDKILKQLHSLAPTLCLVIWLALAISLPPVLADGSEAEVRHFVAFKFKPTVSAEQMEDVWKAFHALKTKIPQVVSMEDGAYSSPEGMNKGFRHAFLLTFANEKDRDTYLNHPEHQKFKAMIAPLIDDGFVFDYLVKRPAAGKPATTSGNSAVDTTAIGNRKVVDLTHILWSDLPDFHAGNSPFKYKSLFSIEKDGYGSGEFTTPEHYGTHMDAPSHFYPGGLSIDQLPADKLVAPCVVIDVRPEVKGNAQYRLTVEKIKEFETQGQIPANSVVLLSTGWADRWSAPASYRNADAKGQMHFPGFSLEAAEYLVNNRHVSGLGIDTLSLDYGDSHDFPVHKFALGKGLFFIENLDNLSKLPPRNALLFMAPLRIKGGTGSPSRVMALIP